MSSICVGLSSQWDWTLRLAMVQPAQDNVSPSRASPPAPTAAPGRQLGEVIAARLTAGTIDVLLSDTIGAAPPASLDHIPARYVVPGHTHDTCEVCWVVEGDCVLYLNGQAVALNPGRACVVQPREVHQLRPTPQLDAFCTLWWRPTPLGVVMHQGVFVAPRRAATTNFVELDAPVMSLLELVVRELRLRRPRYELLVRAALLELAARVLRALEEMGSRDAVPPSQEPKMGWYVERLAQYIQMHHGAEITLERLAAVVGLSPSYVTTLFRRHTGRTVMAYVGDVRHREALSLLRNTDLSVAAVARLVGYEDPYYFSRVFKAREGCAPLQYRRLFRAAPDADSA